MTLSTFANPEHNFLIQKSINSVGTGRGPFQDHFKFQNLI